MIGEPKSSDIAAMLPAAAITACASAGVSLRSERIAKTPSPAPSAISGASGPRTRPPPIVAKAARMIPGSSIGWTGAPPIFRPSAGTWPPSPGSRTIAARDQQPGDPEDDDVEPGGRAVVVAEFFRQVGEEADLDLVDQLEEAPGGERDDDADRRRQGQQHEEGFRRGRAGAAAGGRGGLSHVGSSARTDYKDAAPIRDHLLRVMRSSSARRP